MPILSRSTARRGATILLISVSAAACSGGAASSPAGPTTALAASQPPAALATTADSQSLHTLYCDAIKLPDAQALVKDTITQNYFEPLAVNPPYDCTMVTSAGGSDFLTVSIDTTDSFASWVAEENAGTGTALTGVGDKSVWVQDGTMANAPIVVAIKGSVTCRVTVPQTENTTIEFTNPNGIDQISPAAAATFAQKMAVLCTDVFGASS